MTIFSVNQADMTSLSNVLADLKTTSTACEIQIPGRLCLILMTAFKLKNRKTIWNATLKPNIKDYARNRRNQKRGRERLFDKALDDLRVGRTTLVVAHRLQTIINSDRIFVVENGRAVESGSHDELIRRGGTYSGFFASQFGEAGAQINPPA